MIEILRSNTASINNNTDLVPSALQLAEQSNVVMPACLLIAIFLQSSDIHILLQLSVSHMQDVNLVVLMHLVFGHKPSPAEQFRVTFVKTST